jgi:large subunit ribosomal protein L21
MAKGPKVIIFKHSGRTTLRRKTGHRQKYTQLRIDSITA